MVSKLLGQATVLKDYLGIPLYCVPGLLKDIISKAQTNSAISYHYKAGPYPRTVAMQPRPELYS